MLASIKIYKFIINIFLLLAIIDAKFKKKLFNSGVLSDF